MGNNTATIQTGRLLEIRVLQGYRSAADVDRLFQSVSRELTKLMPEQRIVTVVDWRRCPVMESGAAARLMECMALANERTERSAALVSADAPTAVLQFARLIRESGHPQRKMFMSPGELVAWLDPSLSEPEQKRLRAFLAFVD